MHYLRARQLAKISGQALQPDGTFAPLPATQTNEALAAALQATAADMYARLLTQMQTMQGLAQLVHTIVGGEDVAASIQQIYTMLQSNLASDQTTAADLLNQIQAAQTTASTATTNVQLARLVADNALAATQAQATTLADQGQKIATATSAATAAQTTATKGVTDAATALAEANKRLLRTGDAATGSIMVPTAQLAAAAPRLDQTYGGLNSPIRFATAVGSTAMALQPGPLTDPTPQGRKAKPFQVIITMRSAPVLAATITIGTTPGGSEVFSKTYALTALPVLNNILAPQQPVFLELPAGTTLYAKATSGTWDVEVLSYYKA